MERDKARESMVEATVERPLDVLAEVELLRRKSELFERRLASWEAGLLELRQRLHALETARDPERPSWLEALNDLEHRIDRLERRRHRQALRAAPTVEPAPASGGRSPPPVASTEGAVAIVKGRWSTGRAAPGDAVGLEAETDGIDDGTALALAIHALNSSHPLDRVAAAVDGGRLTARWTVPRGIGPTELFFEVGHAGAHARSNLLVIE